MNLRSNPFYLLQVNPKDTVQAVVSAAEEKSLILGMDICFKAKTILITPQKRLAAEIAWLPGVSSKRCSDLISMLELPSDKFFNSLSGVLPLTQCNLVASFLDNNSNAIDDEHVIQGFTLLTDSFMKIDAASTSAVINEDRRIAQIPIPQDTSAFTSELEQRRKYYCDVMSVSLGRSKNSSSLLSKTLEIALQRHDVLPDLLNSLVEMYVLQSSSKREELEKAIYLHEIEVREYIAVEGFALAVLRSKIDSLLTILKAWDAIAQPIQLRSQNMGNDESRSKEIAVQMRGLAIDLANDHDFYDEAQKITTVLCQVFKELPLFSERLHEDLNKVNEILSRAETANESRQPVPSALSKAGRKYIGILIGLIVLITLVGIFSSSTSDSVASRRSNSKQSKASSKVPGKTTSNNESASKSPKTWPASPKPEVYVTVGQYRCTQYHSQQADLLGPSDHERKLLQIERSIVDELEETVNGVARRIESTYVDNESQESVDQYNALVNRYNRELENFKAKTRAFNLHVDNFNFEIQKYNTYLERNCTRSR